ITGRRCRSRVCYVAGSSRSRLDDKQRQATTSDDKHRDAQWEVVIMTTPTSEESRGEGTAQSRSMERLEPFIGTWQEAVAVPGVPPGRMVFERALDGQIVVQHSEIDHPTFPDSLCIITASSLHHLCIITADATGDGYVQHYFDTRGVVRVY